MASILPSINEQFNGLIWRMEIDSLTDTLFIELRNPEDHLVSFSAIGLKSSSIFYKDLTIDEKWLTGIEAVFDGVLLLHGYQNESSPVHRGLTAIGAGGETLWSNYSYAFDHLSDDGPVVYNVQVQPKKLAVIDVCTGGILKPYTGFEPEMNNEIGYPAAVLDFSEFDLPVEAVPNSGYYLKYNNFIIVSLHAVGDPGFSQHLYVLQNDRVVFEDILNTGIQKLQPEAFIVCKNYLVYIKNKSELQAINLQSTE